MRNKKYRIEICLKNQYHADGTRIIDGVHYTNNYESFIKRLAPANSMFWYDYDIIVIDNETNEVIN